MYESSFFDLRPIKTGIARRCNYRNIITKHGDFCGCTTCKYECKMPHDAGFFAPLCSGRFKYVAGTPERCDTCVIYHNARYKDVTLQDVDDFRKDLAAVSAKVAESASR